MKPIVSRHALIAALAIVCFCLPRAFAGDLQIVANLSVKADTISRRELRSVFLAESNWLKDGSRVQPVLQISGPSHATFLRVILNQNNDFLENHYRSLVFTGKASMPKTFNSDADVVAYVSKTKGAIGYVSSTASTAGVKVLEILPDDARIERRQLTRVEPEYPQALRPLGMKGTVRLQITITPQGRVDSVELLGGNPIFGEAAIKAVRQWSYAASATSSTIEVAIPFDPAQ